MLEVKHQYERISIVGRKQDINPEQPAVSEDFLTSTFNLDKATLKAERFTRVDREQMTLRVSKMPLQSRYLFIWEYLGAFRATGYVASVEKERYLEAIYAMKEWEAVHVVDVPNTIDFPITSLHLLLLSTEHYIIRSRNPHLGETNRQVQEPLLTHYGRMYNMLTDKDPVFWEDLMERIRVRVNRQSEIGKTLSEVESTLFGIEYRMKGYLKELPDGDVKEAMEVDLMRITTLGNRLNHLLSKGNVDMNDSVVSRLLNGTLRFDDDDKE